MAALNDIQKAAKERAAHPNSSPAGSSFETERQRQRNMVGKQFDALDGTRIRKISALTNTDTGSTQRKLRVAAYCRVSTDDLDQALSIHMQQKVYREKIKGNPEWIYAGTYLDNGFSGTNTTHRPGFLRLIDDCRAGKIDMIITKAVSRFARNLLDCIGYIEELSNLDPPVRVFFEQEGLDTSVQTSGIILFVLAMVAEEESHMKSEAMLLSLEWRFSRGRFLTPALFGYDKIEIKDEFGTRKVLAINQQEAKVVKWMYAKLLNGSTPEEIAGVLTELQIPTGGRRKDGSPNTNWTSGGLVSLMRNEKYCGDVLARKTYTPNFKDHKAKKNNGKKNKYFQADHHEAIVTRAVWNAAQRILNSRRFGHEGSYLPMHIVDKGVLTGFISMNRSWAGFDAEDYFRASQIAMGLLDDTLEVDLENEYLPDGGHRLPGLIDDHGISQIARELTEAEQQIKDELDGVDRSKQDLDEQSEIIRTFQVVSGDMFSRIDYNFSTSNGANHALADLLQIPALLEKPRTIIESLYWIEEILEKAEDGENKSLILAKAYEADMKHTPKALLELPKTENSNIEELSYAYWIGYIYRCECIMHDESSRMVYSAFTEDIMRKAYTKVVNSSMNQRNLSDCAKEICAELDRLLVEKIWPEKKHRKYL